MALFARSRFVAISFTVVHRLVANCSVLVMDHISLSSMVVSHSVVKDVVQGSRGVLLAISKAADEVVVAIVREEDLDDIRDVSYVD